MKKLVTAFVLASTLSLPTISFANSKLDSVESIDCTDVAPSLAIRLFFTTHDRHTDAYVRRPGSLPYDYGNLASPYGDSQTGQLTLVNDPGLEGGVMRLADLWDPARVSTLQLKPTANAEIYEGELTGFVETGAGWGPLPSHPVSCVVKSLTK